MTMPLSQNLDRVSRRFARECSLPPEGCQPSQIITICAWCHHLNVIELPALATDIVMLTLHLGEWRAYKNDKPMYVSHGICSEHRQELHAAADIPLPPHTCGDRKDKFVCNLTRGHVGDHQQIDHETEGVVGWSRKEIKP